MAILSALRHAALGCVATLGILTGAAAADLAGQRMADDGLPFVPLFAWAGTHIGINAGAALSSSRPVLACIGPAACPALPLARGDSDGFVAGGQVGYTLQVGRLVGGLEADAQYADIGRQIGAPGIVVGERVDFLGTVRARLGVAADRILVYATGGLAYGDVTTSQSIAIPGGVLAARRGGLEVGFATGGGIEYGLADAVVLRAEALYYDLGRSRLVTGAAGTSSLVRAETDGIVARAGLNYKFSLF